MSQTETSLEEIFDSFEFIEDWEERYGIIIDLGKKMPALDDAYKTEDFRVRGCQSQVWLVPQNDGDKITFQGDSDAVIVRGLVALMLIIYSGKRPQEILDVDAKAILNKLGLEQHLSPLRANGLFAMAERIRAIAAGAASS